MGLPNGFNQGYINSWGGREFPEALDAAVSIPGCKVKNGRPVSGKLSQSSVINERSRFQPPVAAFVKSPLDHAVRSWNSDWYDAKLLAELVCNGMRLYPDNEPTLPKLGSFWRPNILASGWENVLNRFDHPSDVVGETSCLSCALLFSPEIHQAYLPSFPLSMMDGVIWTSSEVRSLPNVFDDSKGTVVSAISVNWGGFVGSWLVRSSEQSHPMKRAALVELGSSLPVLNLLV